MVGRSMEWNVWGKSADVNIGLSYLTVRPSELGYPCATTDAFDTGVRMECTPLLVANTPVVERSGAIARPLSCVHSAENDRMTNSLHYCTWDYCAVHCILYRGRVFFLFLVRFLHENLCRNIRTWGNKCGNASKNWRNILEKATVSVCARSRVRLSAAIAPSSWDTTIEKKFKNIVTHIVALVVNVPIISIESIVRTFQWWGMYAVFRRRR